MVFLLIAAAILSYFTLFLGTQFDRTMVLNMFQTHRAEAFQLVSFSLICWVALTGILPAWVAWRIASTPSKPHGAKRR